MMEFDRPQKRPAPRRRRPEEEAGRIEADRKAREKAEAERQAEARAKREAQQRAEAERRKAKERAAAESERRRQERASAKARADAERRRTLNDQREAAERAAAKKRAKQKAREEAAQTLNDKREAAERAAAEKRAKKQRSEQIDKSREGAPTGEPTKTEKELDPAFTQLIGKEPFSKSDPLTPSEVKAIKERTAKAKQPVEPDPVKDSPEFKTLEDAKVAALENSKVKRLEKMAAISFPDAVDPKTGKVDLAKVPLLNKRGGAGAITAGIAERELSRSEQLERAIGTKDGFATSVLGESLISFVPVAGTAYFWNEMSPTWRAISIALDAVDVVTPFVPVGAYARQSAGFVRGANVVKAEKNLVDAFANMTSDVAVFDAKLGAEVTQHAKNAKQYGKDYAKLRQLEDLGEGISEGKQALGSKTLAEQTAKAKDAAAKSKAALNDSGDALEKNLKDAGLKGEGSFNQTELKRVAATFDGMAVDHIRRIENAVDTPFDSSPALVKSKEGLASSTAALEESADILTKAKAAADDLGRAAIPGEAATGEVVLRNNLLRFKRSLKDLDKTLSAEGPKVEAIIARNNKKAAQAYTDGNLTSARAASMDASDAANRLREYAGGEFRELDKAALALQRTIKTANALEFDGKAAFMAEAVDAFSDIATRRNRALNNLNAYAEANPNAFAGIGGPGTTPSGGTLTPSKTTRTPRASIDTQVNDIIKNAPTLGLTPVGVDPFKETRGKAQAGGAVAEPTKTQPAIPNPADRPTGGQGGPGGKPKGKGVKGSFASRGPAGGPEPEDPPPGPGPRATETPTEDPPPKAEPGPKQTPTPGKGGKKKPETVGGPGRERDEVFIEEAEPIIDAPPKPVKTPQIVGAPAGEPEEGFHEEPAAAIKPPPSPAPKPEPRPDPARSPFKVGTGAPSRPRPDGTPRARGRPTPKPKKRFSLPDGRKLERGVFPEVVEYDQGITRVRHNLFTNRRTFKKLSRPTGQRPRDTLKVVSTSERAPRDRKFIQGFIKGEITPRSLTFTRRRGL